MKSPPDWANTKECPVEGCDGKYWIDVGGSAVQPVTEYPSTCPHDINDCWGCNEKRAIVEKFWWPAHDERVGSPGRTQTVRFCKDCDDPETIRRHIPDWVFERGWVQPEEVGR